MLGRGGDAQARQDMFPTAVPEWRAEERVGSAPIGESSSFDVVAHPVAEHLRALARLRDSHPALATGATVLRLARGKILALSRIDAQARREYLVVFNPGETPRSVVVSAATPSTSWTPLLGKDTAARSDASGRLMVDVPALSAVALRAGIHLPRRRPGTPELRVSEDPLTGLTQLTAAVPTADPVSVTFAVRRTAEGKWQRIATDDTPPYRAFVDSHALLRGRTVYIVAIVRASDGRLIPSSVKPLTIARS